MTSAVFTHNKDPVCQAEMCKKINITLSLSLSGEVLMPSGKSAQPLITDNLDGTVTVQYSPTEAGLHEMHIKYNGTHIPGQYTHAEEHDMMISVVQKRRSAAWFLSDMLT